MKSRWILVAIFTFIFLLVLDGQVPSNPIGNNRIGLDWRQINYQGGSIIYPAEIASTAQRIAHILNYQWQAQDSSIGFRRLNSPIIIHSESALSNGFVTVGPFRSELFPVHRQFAQAVNFSDRLAIHEYRHIQQFANATQGITGLTRKVLGSWAWGGLLGMSMPRWYFEGDAVVAETRFTKAGRGRLPQFLNEYRPYFLENKTLNFEKAAAGSLKDYVPSWYHLGYQMITQANQSHGTHIWPEIVSNASRYKGIFFPFDKGLKKETGYSLEGLYGVTMDNLRADFDMFQGQSNKATNQQDNSIIHKKPKRTVTHYSNPIVVGHSIFAVKQGYSDLAHIVEINSAKKEKKVVDIGIQTEGPLSRVSYANNCFVWSQLGFHVRRRYKQSSDLYCYNQRSKLKKKLSQGERYYSPALNESASKIVAVHIGKDLLPSLHLINTFNGDVEGELEIMGAEQIVYPIWLSSSKIAFLYTRGETFYLGLYDLHKKAYKDLYQFDNAQLSFPFKFDEGVCFSVGWNGVDDILCVNVSSDNSDIYKLSDASVGAYQANVDAQREFIYYSELTTNGYAIKKNKLLKGKIAQSIFSKRFAWSDIDQESSIMSDIDTFHLESSAFNEFEQAIRPHSLLVNFGQNSVSANLLSDDYFGNTSASINYNYNFLRSESSSSFRLTHAKLFPELTFVASSSSRSYLFSRLERRAMGDRVDLFNDLRRWREGRVGLGMRLPFNFSSGNNITSLSVFSRVDYINESDKENVDQIIQLDNLESELIEMVDMDISYLGDDYIRSISGLSFFTGRRLTRQALNPRWGFGIDYLFGTNHRGVVSHKLESRIYVPGLFKSHAFSLRGSAFIEDSFEAVRLLNEVERIRGLGFDLRSDRRVVLSGDYAFPIVYPDLAFNRIAFIKRLKGNFFFDYSLDHSKFVKLQNGLEHSMSYGIELGFDVRVFRRLEVDCGIRVGRYRSERLLQSKGAIFEFYINSISE